MKLGYEGALAESDRFWAESMSGGARIETPERLINEAIAMSLKFNDVLAIRIPETEQIALMSGSLVYARLWATPSSMNLHMMLDIMGRYAAAERYLEIFREEQGKIAPPGPAFARHPGYFSTPPSLTSIDWLSDHGSILHAVCTHALLSGDRAFLDRWLEPILKACDFIKDARAIEGHGGAPGVMPPATCPYRKLYPRL